MKPSRRFNSSGSRASSCPSTLTEPRVHSCKPETARMVVVLPAPFGPMRPHTSPASTVRERSLTATTSGKSTRRCSMVSDGLDMGRLSPSSSKKQARPIRAGDNSILADAGCAGLASRTQTRYVPNMSTQEILLEEIKHQPEQVLREVWHYLKFLTRQREEEAWADVLPSRQVEQEVLDHLDGK